MNCNALGHASWDQLCPRFIEECRKAERTDPEHTYRYFPSREAWTWEQEGRGKREVTGGRQAGGIAAKTDLELTQAQTRRGGSYQPNFAGEGCGPTHQGTADRPQSVQTG